MADTYRHNEVLAWLKWHFTKFDKSYILTTLGSFFHEDELLEEKNELANVNPTADKIDDWLYKQQGCTNQPLWKRRMQ